MKRPASSMLVICLGAGIAALALPASAAAATGTSARCIAQSGIQLAQDESGENVEVPPDQVEKYIKVYQAMQKNHSLTVQQAAAQQGLTEAQFRSLENRVERNDILRERVRRALRNQPSATQTQ